MNVNNRVSPFFIFLSILSARIKTLKSTMPKIPIEIRKLIIKDQKNGISKREIARRYEISEGAVRKICKKFEKIGIINDKSGRGRKRKTTAMDDRKIIREVKKNPTITSRVILQNTASIFPTERFVGDFEEWA